MKGITVGFLDDLKKNLGLGDKDKAKGAPGTGAGVDAGTSATQTAPADSATPAVSQDEAAANQAAADQAAADQTGASQAADAQAAAAVPAATPAPASVSEVVVEAGDTLSGIAQQFGVGLDALIAANADTVPNPDLIYPGQVLRLP